MRTILVFTFALVIAVCAVTKDAWANTPPKVTNYHGVYNGVSPLTGYSGDTFSFGFDYDDPDGDPCVRCEVWLDKNHDGTFSEDEKYALRKQDERGIYTGYARKIQLYNRHPQANIHFRFYASDGKDEASSYNVGFNDPERNAVTVKARLLPLPSKPAEEYRSIAGGRFVYELSILVEYTFLQDIVLLWDKLLAQTDFGPISLIDFSLRERYHSEDYNQITAELLFRVSQDAADGAYDITFAPLPFLSGGTKKEHTVSFERGSYLIEPYLVRGPEMVRTASFIGEPFAYEFSVLVGARHDPRDVLDVDPDQITMAPFRVLNADIARLETEDGAHRLDYRFRLALFAAPGEYELPPLQIQKLKLPAQPFVLHAVNPPAAIPKNALEYSKLLRELKNAARARRADFSGVYGGDVYLYASAMAFAVIFLITGVHLASSFRTRLRSATFARDLTASRMRYEYAQEQYRADGSLGNLARLYHALRAYMFALSNSEDVPGYSAKDLEDGNGRLDRNQVSEELLARLVRLENEYFEREGG